MAKSLKIHVNLSTSHSEREITYSPMYDTFKNFLLIEGLEEKNNTENALTWTDWFFFRPEFSYEDSRR